MPTPTLAEWDAMRSGNPNAAPESASSPSPLPSGAATLGSLLGLYAPELTIPGAAIASSAKELVQSVPKLVKAGFGPMSSEGVGEAMLEPATNIAGDVAKTAVLNKLPGWLGTLAGKAGTAMTRFGASEAATAPAWQRAAVGAVLDPVMNAAGVPHGVTEAATIMAPPAARVAGPALTAVGKAMPNSVIEGLRSAALRMKPGIPEPPPPPEAESVRTTVDTARNLLEKGQSRGQAAQRAGWPLGKSTEVPYRAGGGTTTTDPFEGRLPNGELSTPAQRAAIRGLKEALHYHDPREPMVVGEPGATVGGLSLRDQEVLDLLKRTRTGTR